ncbi:MAG: hypothetical protein PWQ88_931 [Candidatus Methanomethylophilaceae archaeon]|nr:MAG: Uncharacterized protein XE14_0011 [Thermoplasmatales archaeon 49_6]MDI3483060.1 hypothetical protein [Candidatus Methanomethylophilaceae archaeon]MDI3542153.1 hypothetical protein [Candidatus Methanomethylophilaceae archaeon]HIJ00919.1 iron-sulfur cluster assembly accessory protein [Candidatus Methanomethylophilaceae archaeon]
MVEITPEAEKFLKELLEQNDKQGQGVKIYLAGMACSGPQFGMKFQAEKEEGDTEIALDGFSFYFDDETGEALEDCVIKFIDDPQLGTGLTIENLKATGCSGCSSGCC